MNLLRPRPSEVHVVISCVPGVTCQLSSRGTYKALENHLRDVTAKQGEGYYHVIHFDVHGAVLNYGQLQKGQEASRYLYKRYAREKAIQPYEAVKAFLSFEPEADDREHTSDLVEADELANLLVNYHIPITILNACQSGDSGSHEHDGSFTVVAMEKEVQASIMHEQRFREKRVGQTG